ncbi:Uncharacterized acetyltransferase At3g50280 [Linum perenne]
MADEKLRVLSTDLVQAANTQTPERIPLTPCDLKLILVGTIQKGLLFSPKPQSNHQSLITNLRSSFSRALALFYPFAGRLSADEHPDGTASVYIDCNNAGALFIHAAADAISVADILDPVYVPRVLWSFFPLNSVRSRHGFSQPFLAVQVTELVDGVFIGCTVSHAVADGTTFWRFMNRWSEICRGGSGDICNLPAFTREWFLNEKHRPIRFPWTMVRDFKEEDGGVVVVPQQLKERVFHFSRRNLAALKAQANAEAGGKTISSLKSLVSHIWRAVTRNREKAVIRNRENPDPDLETVFVIHIGLRSRLQPKLPEDYFGNAISRCTVAMKEKALLKKGLGELAAEIDKVVTDQTDEKLKKAVESWIENPVMRSVGRLPKGTLVLSSSPRYDVYGNDFGWGKPVAVRSGAGNKFDGKVTVFPGVEEGSIDVEICLSSETVERLGSDSEFMAAVGTVSAVDVNRI